MFCAQHSEDYAKSRTLHLLCEEALLFPKALFLRCFENLTLFGLLVSVGLGIIMVLVPPGEGVPVAAAGVNSLLPLPSDTLTAFCN